MPQRTTSKLLPEYRPLRVAPPERALSPFGRAGRDTLSLRVMSSFQVRCPQCSRLLSAAGSGQVNIRCAACGTVFGVQIAQPVGPAAPSPPPPPPQSFASFQAVPTPTAVQNLCALGFSEAQARAALRSSDGDVERAATLLLATPRETGHAASPSHAATPAPARDAEDRELQQALEASRRESQQSSIPVAVAFPASAGTTAPVAVAATAVAAGAAAAAAGVRAPPLLNTTVELQSLIRRPELNGQQGIAETWEHGRYQARYLVITPPETWEHGRYQARYLVITPPETWEHGRYKARYLVITPPETWEHGRYQARYLVITPPETWEHGRYRCGCRTRCGCTQAIYTHGNRRGC